MFTIYEFEFSFRTIYKLLCILMHVLVVHFLSEYELCYGSWEQVILGLLPDQHVYHQATNLDWRCCCTCIIYSLLSASLWLFDMRMCRWWYMWYFVTYLLFLLYAQILYLLELHFLGWSGINQCSTEKVRHVSLYMIIQYQEKLRVYMCWYLVCAKVAR